MNSKAIGASCAAALIAVVVFAFNTESDSDRKEDTKDTSHSSLAKNQKKKSAPKSAARWMTELSSGRRPGIKPAEADAAMIEMKKAGDIRGLATLYLLSQNLDILKELRLHPDDPAACEALALGGETAEERRDWAARLGELKPGDSAAALLLASALHELGQDDEAKARIESLDLGGPDDLGILAALESQAAMWRTFGATQPESAILSLETGYPSILVNTVASTLLNLYGSSPEDGSGQTSGIAMEVLERLKKSGVQGKSFGMDRTLLNAEIAIKRASASESESLAADLQREKSLRLVESKVSFVLMEDKSGLQTEFYSNLSKGDLKSASKWLLGDSPEIEAAFK